MNATRIIKVSSNYAHGSKNPYVIQTYFGSVYDTLMEKLVDPTIESSNNMLGLTPLSYWGQTILYSIPAIIEFDGPTITEEYRNWTTSRIKAKQYNGNRGYDRYSCEDDGHLGNAPS